MPKSVADHPSVLRVRDELIARGLPDRVRVLSDSTRTAAEAAAALGVDVGQIASSLVFHVGGTPVLVVASGAYRVNTELLSALFDGAPVTKPNATEVRDATGFAIGGVAPIAHPSPLIVIIDQSLAEFDEVWAAAGHPYAVFGTTFAELLTLTGGRAVRVQGA